MWEKLMGICNKRVLRDVESEADVNRLGSQRLLAELIRIDLKGRADNRQVRNIDLTKRVQNGKSLSIDE